MKRFTLYLIFVFISFNSAFAQNWVSQTSGTTNNLTGIYFLNADTGYDVGIKGTILLTTDGGANWMSQTSGTTNDLNQADFPTDSKGWAVGSAGIIINTTNAGSSWSKQTSGTSNNLNAVEFPTDKIGWAVGCAGTILHTSNGGSSWEKQMCASSSDNLNGVTFSSVDTGWIVGDNGTILNTTNGGTSWVKQSSSSGCGSNNLDAVFFIDDNNGYAVGTNGTIIHTTSGGSKWVDLSGGTTKNLHGVTFADSHSGWVVGDKGTIINTTNGGSSWLSQSSGVTADLNSTSFANLTSGWASGAAGTIIHTSNGGGASLPVELVSFTASANGNNVTLNWKTATEINNKGFEVQKTVDGNWINLGFVNGNGTTTNEEDYSFLDNSAGSGDVTYRIEQIDFDGSSKFSNEVSVAIAPTSFELLQNYPNPFNPSTIITYQLPSDSKVILKVYNILGEEVATLVNEGQKAGEYKINFNANNLASGIYLYQLRVASSTSENFVETKKMTILR
jgi:photosystem II stability/assembly factor-like uncharacterized protein